MVLNQIAKIDFQLKIGNVSTAVEINSTSPMLQTETTDVGTVMESREIEALPLETRNYNQLALLIPAPSPPVRHPLTPVKPPLTPAARTSTVIANRPVTICSTAWRTPSSSTNNVAFSPSVDAIQEFNVITNNPSAEYGQFLGGVISVSTKSGTNHYHGGVFEFLRNDIFNANEWSRNFSTGPDRERFPPEAAVE